MPSILLSVRLSDHTHRHLQASLSQVGHPDTATFLSTTTRFTKHNRHMCSKVTQYRMHWFHRLIRYKRQQQRPLLHTAAPDGLRWCIIWGYRYRYRHRLSHCFMRHTVTNICRQNVGNFLQRNILCWVKGVNDTTVTPLHTTTTESFSVICRP